jgi:dsDNA-specific endonuclease/ATPase MutS2
LRTRLEKAEKMAKDNQAWATKAAQEAAQLRREREQEQRAKAKPAILDANPELADAIRYVAQDPATERNRATRALRGAQKSAMSVPGAGATVPKTPVAFRAGRSQADSKHVSRRI